MKILNRIIVTAGCAAALLVLAGCRTTTQNTTTTTTATATPGTTELFNGKNFDGWTFCMKTNADPKKTWRVKDGLMCCTGQPYGYARTQASYQDYALTCVWRFVKIAPHADDSGIFVQLQLPDKVWPTGYQCQGKYGRQGDLMLGGTAIAMGHPVNGKRSVPQMGTSYENRPGEWNTNRVVCNGNGIVLFVNDRMMNHLTGCNYTSGFVGIQSEGGNIEVRELSLKSLK